ncbi:MAG: hypothetical protein NTV23_00375 [Propionibacteriales bacterium]|nr:hypothetical protein [Propionibacteriales bacterium]
MNAYRADYWKADPIMDAMAYPQEPGLPPLSPAESERRYVERLHAVREQMAGADLVDLLEQAYSDPPISIETES